jgi:ring-1,2-phenylacetyl-CoA epoxidase subunit PaaC
MPMPAQVEGKGRDEDQLAFLRLERDYRNLLLVERPNGDFAHTVLRQFYFAAYMKPYWDWIAVNSTDETLRGIAGKAAKEMAYHVRHCGEWVIRLGDGTEEVRRGCGQPLRRCIAIRQSCSRIRPPLGFAWGLAFCLPATA